MLEGRQMRSCRAPFCTRAEETEQGQKIYIEGYFAVFDSPYELGTDMYETVATTAFDGALEDDIRCLADHDSLIVLGRSKTGTLALHVDEKGLWGSVEINPNDQDAMNLYARVKRGDVDQCSFGFDVLAEEHEYDPDGKVHWIIKRVKLYEVSVVTFPAYEETGVAARKKDLEEIRRREGEAWRQKRLARLKGE